MTFYYCKKCGFLQPHQVSVDFGDRKVACVHCFSKDLDAFYKKNFADMVKNPTIYRNNAKNFKTYFFYPNIVRNIAA